MDDVRHGRKGENVSDELPTSARTEAARWHGKGIRVVHGLAKGLAIDVGDAAVRLAPVDGGSDVLVLERK